MSFFLKRFVGSDAIELSSIYTLSFYGDYPIVPIATTLGAATIQSVVALDPGDTRTAQICTGTAGSGTVAVSGSNVTGTGTAFLTELAVGDYIRIPAEGQAIGGLTTNHRVATRPNDTALTIEDSFATPFSGKPWIAITRQGSIVTLTGPASQGTGDFGGVVVPVSAAGDTTKLVYVEIKRVGSPAADDQRLVIEYTAGTSASIYAGQTGTIDFSVTPPSNDFFSALALGAAGSPSVFSTIEGEVVARWPRSGTFSKLAVRMASNGFTTATETVEVVLRKNGTDTALAVGAATVDPGKDNVTRDDVNTVAVSAGDLICFRWKILSSGSAAEEGFIMSPYCIFQPA